MCGSSVGWPSRTASSSRERGHLLAKGRPGEKVGGLRVARPLPIDTDQGLTQFYNRLKLKDPREDDLRVLALRRQLEDLDHAVLRAYGWPEISVPPYTTPETEPERRAVEVFEDDVIDRLFQLNATRAQEERRLGLAAQAKAKKARAVRKQVKRQPGPGLFD